MNQFEIIFTVLLVLLAVGVLWYRSRRNQPVRKGSAAVSDPWAEQRRLEARRLAENARPYDAAALPTALTQVSLIEYYFAYRDEEYAAVYLMPDRVALPSEGVSKFDLFSRYWDMHADALWTWRGDNLTDRLTHEAMIAAIEARKQAMLDKLIGAGWRVTGRDAYSHDLKIVYLSR